MTQVSRFFAVALASVAMVAGSMPATALAIEEEATYPKTKPVTSIDGVVCTGTTRLEFKFAFFGPLRSGSWRAGIGVSCTNTSKYIGATLKSTIVVGGKSEDGNSNELLGWTQRVACFAKARSRTIKAKSDWYVKLITTKGRTVEVRGTDELSRESKCNRG